MPKALRRSITWLSVLFFLLIETMLLGAQERRCVLALHSFGMSFRWTLELDAAIREVLEHDGDGTVSVYSEMLDARYHTGDRYLAEVASFLERKYDGWSFDCITVSNSFALEFVRRYREVLWPGVPVVFAGISDYNQEQTTGLTEVTGVVEELDVVHTIDVMRDLFPDRSRLFVLADKTSRGERNLSLALKALEDSDLVVVVHNPTTVDSLTALASEIGGNDLVLMVALVLDESGRPLDSERSGRVVSETLPAPVFSLWDFFMNTGIAGGYMSSGREQGLRAAELVGRILAGEDPEVIPVVEESLTVPVFDFAVLSRYGIAQEDLVEGSIVYNQPPSMWREYRSEILLFAFVMVLLVLLALYAYEVARQRGRVARETAKSLREKVILLRELHHRVKNNLQVVSSMLNIQSGFVTDGTSLGYFQDCRARIQSMALVHEHLYRSPSLAQVGMKKYIGDLAKTVVRSMGRSPELVRIEVNVADILVTLDQAIPLGMVTNELLSNAIKYAYPDGAGAILVLLEHTEEQGHLEVNDHGVGITNDEIERHDSLGLQLVNELVKQLDGSIRFEDNNPGLRVCFDFPLVPHDLRDEEESAG